MLTLLTQGEDLDIFVKRLGLGLGLGLGTGIGDWNWGLGLGSGIGDWDWGLGLGTGIGKLITNERFLGHPVYLAHKVSCSWRKSQKIPEN